MFSTDPHVVNRTIEVSYRDLGLDCSKSTNWLTVVVKVVGGDLVITDSLVHYTPPGALHSTIDLVR